jgi:hypothetical protein
LTFFLVTLLGVKYFSIFILIFSNGQNFVYNFAWLWVAKSHPRIECGLAGSGINPIVQVVPKIHGTAFASGCEFNSSLSIFRAKLMIANK